jgi:hypothetical protein
MDGREVDRHGSSHLDGRHSGPAGSDTKLWLHFAAEAPHPISAAAAARPNRLTGTVARSTFLGNARRIALELAGQTVELDMDVDMRPTIGERVAFEVRPEDCSILPERP